MAAPLFTSAKITTYLKSKISNVEVFDEFPTDMKNVRHGVYVNDPATIDRVPYALAVNLGSNIYTATDSMRIILVTFQGDNRRDDAVTAITGLVIDDVLMDGYHERDFTMSQEYLNRAEYRIYDFNLLRIELQ
jgi:hypothetical protein